MRQQRARVCPVLQFTFCACLFREILIVIVGCFLRAFQQDRSQACVSTNTAAMSQKHMSYRFSLKRLQHIVCHVIKKGSIATAVTVMWSFDLCQLY